MGSRGGGGGSAPVSIGASGSQSRVYDPETGRTYTVASDKADEAQRQMEKDNAKAKGLVPYEDPFKPTGKPQYVTPADKKLRTARDNAKIKAKLAAEQTQSPYANLSPEAIVSHAVEGSLPIEAMVKELQSRGKFSRDEIDLLVRSVLIKQAAKKKGARSLFGDEEATAPSMGW